MARLSAFVVVAPWSWSANDECAKYEKTEPAQFARCKDECILEADFNEATQALEACNRVCEETNKGSAADVGKCMETCTIKVDLSLNPNCQIQPSTEKLLPQQAPCTPPRGSQHSSSGFPTAASTTDGVSEQPKVRPCPRLPSAHRLGTFPFLRLIWRCAHAAI
jgi:hypothetical protein